MAQRKIKRISPNQAAVMGKRGIDTERMYRDYYNLYRRRMKSFRERGESWRQIYQENINRFEPLQTIDKADLPAALSEISGFLSSKLSTVRGAKAHDAKVIQSLNDLYSNIDESGNIEKPLIGSEEELKKFGAFMEYARATGAAMTTGGSAEALKKYKRIRSKGRKNKSLNTIINEFNKMTEERRE